MIPVDRERLLMIVGDSRSVRRSSPLAYGDSYSFEESATAVKYLILGTVAVVVVKAEYLGGERVVEV